MKELIKHYIVAVSLALFTIFCIRYLITDSVNGIGSIFENVNTKQQKSNSHLLLKEITEETPNVKYIGGTKQVGDVVIFKELFEVGISGGNYQSGIKEEGFSLYFEDIQNQYGDSMVTYLNTEEIEVLEEIPSAFIFDIEQQQLYFYKSGTFLMYIKVYTENGSSTIYSFTIPVEVS